MEGGEHSLVPQWLKSNGSASRVASTKNQLTSSMNSDHINYPGFQRSLGSKRSGFSRSYSSSGRSWHDTEKEKDIENLLDKDKLFNGQYDHDYSDYVNSILSNRFEKDVLQRSKSLSYGRWRENRSPRSSGDISNPQRNRAKSDDMVAGGGVGMMDKTVFEEEFPLLGVEDKHGSSELGGMSSSSSSTLSLLTRTSPLFVSNVHCSKSDGIQVTSASSIAPGTTGLSMAETLAQGPSRSPTPPQISVGTQKLEELALKQSRLLIPMTPPTPRSLVASPSEKLKVKTGPQQYPFSHSRSPGRSPHCAPGNSDIQKISSGKSRNLSGSQELNGVSLAAKDNLSPSRSRVLSPTGAATSTSLSAPSRSSSNNSNPCAWLTLEKRPTFQTESRSDFLKNLSKKSCSTNHCSDACPDAMSCALETAEAGTSTVPCSVNSLTEKSCVITENGTASSEALKFSCNGEQQYSSSTKPVLYPDEEIAFLRSLGWEESGGEDEGLTEEEIRDFYDKYLKLQPSSNIV